MSHIESLLVFVTYLLSILLNFLYNQKHNERWGENMGKISVRIIKLRKSKQLTQQELGKKLNLSRSTIANYEQGTRIPSTNMLISLANYFNVSTDYLLGRTDLKFNIKKWFQDNRQILLIINSKTGEIHNCSLGAISFYKYNKNKLVEKSFFDVSSLDKKKLNTFIDNK